MTATYSVNVQVGADDSTWEWLAEYEDEDADVARDQANDFARAESRKRGRVVEVWRQACGIDVVSRYEEGQKVS